uniref:C2H2-type domain-containing protein n=1 Tax=Mesocestoides corti TaxID=53468 RepID=A0A5K3FR46_MESCO
MTTNSKSVSISNGLSSSIDENASFELDGAGMLLVEPPQRPTSERVSQKKTSGPSISFSREMLLKIKESELSHQEPDESCILTSSKVLFKILRPECKILERQSKSQDHGSIVLGPQKRSWNTGCHVSQTKRCPQDSTVSKTHKNSHENKFSRGDFKRDSKGSERSSGRSGFNSNSGHSRSGVQDRGDATSTSTMSDCFHNTEKEPEWFTEGPETINDTVELGLVIDDGDAKVRKSLKDKESENSSRNPSEVDSAILSVDSVKLSTSPSLVSTNANAADLLKLLDLPKKNDEGSRFRHLFEKASPKTSVANVGGSTAISENVNSKLLQLLACSGDSSAHQKQIHHLSTSQPSAKDLELALKALFLGGDNQKSGNMSLGNLQAVSSPTVTSKPNIMAPAPTVEEIEAVAFSAGSGGAPPKHPSAQSCALLDQLAHQWILKQRARPQSCGFGDGDHLTPISLEVLEAVQQRENSLLSTTVSCPPGLEPYQERSVTNWNETFLSGAPLVPSGVLGSPSSSSSLMNNFLAAKMHQNLPINRQVPPPPGLMPPTDPPVALQQPQRRPIVKSLSVVDPSVVQKQSRQQPCFGFNPNPGMPTPGLRPATGVEAALLQLKKNASTGLPTYSVPHSSAFSSSGAVCAGNSGSNRLEHLLLAPSARASAGGTSSSHTQSQFRQNVSVPNLLLPPSWQAAVPPVASSSSSISTDLFRSVIAGSGGGGGGGSSPNSAPGLELTAVHKDAP